MYITTRVTLEFMSHRSRGEFKEFGKHTCLPRSQSGLGCKVKHLRRIAVVGPRQLMVNHLYFFFKPYVAIRSYSRSSSLWDKTSRNHLASPAAAVVPD
jgi:hypothetical protein